MYVDWGETKKDLFCWREEEAHSMPNSMQRWVPELAHVEEGSERSHSVPKRSHSYSEPGRTSLGFKWELLAPCSHSLCNSERKLHKTPKKYLLPSLYHLSLANATLSHFLVVSGCLWPCFLSSHLFHLVKVCCGMSTSAETKALNYLQGEPEAWKTWCMLKLVLETGFPNLTCLLYILGQRKGVCIIHGLCFWWGWV